ncbi:RING-H2 finger protein ATL3-like [Andrographis paniculata]|uniref:RING-H2 finger protein ATL3-like n=1 Tax=Andrographis paniculata TaxID=175694 RepID=UPI0021E74A9B|nr:RING-H2 finger protein ATL3-like [Andrographis paniculata]
MTARSRFLAGGNSPAEQPGQSSPNINNRIDSDFVVILASLLCAVICVLGLVAVARCAWIRRFSDGRDGEGHQTTSAAAANKGVKKKVLKSLPRLTYGADSELQAEDLTECAICLADFADGEQVRVLPQCGHVFHVTCIDTWLGSHSSCPSCRQLLRTAFCQQCGGLPTEPCSAARIQPEPRESHVTASSSRRTARIQPESRENHVCTSSSQNAGIEPESREPHVATSSSLQTAGIEPEPRENHVSTSSSETGEIEPEPGEDHVSTSSSQTGGVEPESRENHVSGSSSPTGGIEPESRESYVSATSSQTGGMEPESRENHVSASSSQTGKVQHEPRDTTCTLDLEQAQIVKPSEPSSSGLCQTVEK